MIEDESESSESDDEEVKEVIVDHLEVDFSYCREINDFLPNSKNTTKVIKVHVMHSVHSQNSRISRATPSREIAKKKD